jgi:formylglycine-generating enzyme required for sulfatase activity
VIVCVVFRHISADVYTATESKQLPELSLSVIGDFYLKGRPPAEPIPAADEVLWTTIKDSRLAELFEEFVTRFPASTHVSQARDRIAELSKEQTTVVLKADRAKSASTANPAPNTQVAAVAPPVAPTSPAVTSGSCGSAPVTVSLSSRSSCPLSAAEERALKPKDMFKECDKCPEMVMVPAGRFTMGSSGDKYGNEGPQHRVTISRAFAVGKFAVTVDQFSDFVNETGYDAGTKCWTLEDGGVEERPGRSFRNPGFSQTGSHPAVCLSWNDAKAYTQWLSKTTGRPYRLLTEAEWEYAARAGTTTRYFFGDNENGFCRYGNGSDQTAKSEVRGRIIVELWSYLPCSDGYAYTAPVGSFLPNAFGLYDMYGNAQQWLEDCWHNNYTDAPSDGSAWTIGNFCREHALRGGSWESLPIALRATNRYAHSSDARVDDGGFRVARTLAP